uniref:Nuclear condensin complex subunit 3 C-terminal domain-containing protein n=1 Tax=Acrobeloides nanus TaxID=290746 RepID=A0A914EDP2_9BILA
MESTTSNMIFTSLNLIGANVLDEVFCNFGVKLPSIHNCTTEEQKDAFFKELRYRMNFLTVSFKDLNPNRMRCLLLIVRTSVKVFNTVGEHGLFNFLAEFCQTCCDAISPIVRRYVCLLSGLIFSISVINNQNDDESQSLLSKENYQKLFCVLKKRWLDKNTDVRKEAIHALANIQDDPVNPDFEVMMDCSAKDMISLSLGDRDSECRIEAIRSLSMKESRDFKYVLKLAHHDQDLIVQKEAIRRLADDMPYTMVTNKERIDLIERIIAHPDEEVREMLGVLLYEWIAQACYLERRDETKDPTALCAGSLYLLKHINFLDNEQTIESALFGTFDRLLDEFYQTDGDEAILALAEAFSDRNHACLNRANYKKLLNMNIQMKDKSALAFHWHNLIAFCCSNQFPENLRTDCRFKLVPSMKTYAEFVQEFLATFGAMNNRSPRRGQANQESHKRFCIIQLLKIFPYLDQDQHGMKAWKELLFHILSSRVIELHAKLVEQITQNLMEFHFPKDEDTEVALHEFVDVINEVVSKANPHSNITRPLPNDTLSQDLNATINNLNVTIDVPTRRRCLTIFNGMMKSGRFNVVGAIIQSLFDFIVVPSFTLTDKEDRILAYEVSGIISIFHDQFARTHFIFLLKNAFQLEIKSVKLACIEIIGDLVLAHKYEKVAEMYVSCDPSDIPEDDDDEEVLNLSELLNQMIAFSGDESDKQLAFAATETLIRWMMAEHRPEWSDALTHLLILSFRQDVQENPKLRGLLSRFFPMFAAVSRANQLQLVNIFEKVMDKLRNRLLDGSMISINEEEVALWLAKWTSPSILENIGDDMKEGSVHKILAKIILEDLDQRGDVDDHFVYIYCKVASVLELDLNIDDEELDELVELCTSVIKDMSSAPKNLKLLNVFLKRLHTLQMKRNPQQQHNMPRPESTTVPRAPSATTSASATPSLMSPVPPESGAEDEPGLEMDKVLENLKINTNTHVPSIQSTPQIPPKTPKTAIRISNKKKLTVKSLTQEFFARGRESAIKREIMSAVQATPKGPPVTGPAARLRNRTTKLKTPVDAVREEPEEKTNEAGPTARPKRQPRSAKIKVPNIQEENMLDEEA